MNTIPAQEIKRRGIAAVDGLIAQGDVHVIRNNRPEYVVLTEARYQELVAEAEEAYVARVKASLEDVKAGRVWRGSRRRPDQRVGVDGLSMYHLGLDRRFYPRRKKVLPTKHRELRSKFRRLSCVNWRSTRSNPT